MRIINHVQGFKKDEFAFICNKCGCYFIARENEMKGRLCRRDGTCENIRIDFMFCPDCSAKVYPFNKLQKDLVKGD